MKKSFIISAIGLTMFLHSCNENVSKKGSLAETKVDSLSALDTVRKITNLNSKPHIRFVQNVDYLKKTSISEKSKPEFVEEVEFLDGFIAFFRYDADIDGLNMDSLHTALHIRAFHPSDSVYYAEACAPKVINQESVTIKDYGAVSLYYFGYESKPACEVAKPILILNTEKKELIIIEANGIKILSNKSALDILFNTRGNISKYKLKYTNGMFVYGG